MGVISGLKWLTLLSFESLRLAIFSRGLYLKEGILSVRLHAYSIELNLGRAIFIIMLFREFSMASTSSMKKALSFILFVLSHIIFMWSSTSYYYCKFTHWNWYFFEEFCPYNSSYKELRLLSFEVQLALFL